jgi:hypothetical protein
MQYSVCAELLNSLAASLHDPCQADTMSGYKQTTKLNYKMSHINYKKINIMYLLVQYLSNILTGSWCYITKDITLLGHVYVFSFLGFGVAPIT